MSKHEDLDRLAYLSFDVVDHPELAAELSVKLPPVLKEVEELRENIDRYLKMLDGFFMYVDFGTLMCDPRQVVSICKRLTWMGPRGESLAEAREATTVQLGFNKKVSYDLDIDYAEAIARQRAALTRVV